MKTAAIGIRVHSGWGALMAVSGKTGAEEVIERRRLEIIETKVAELKVAGSKQPYHYAKEMALEKAEAHIAKCAAASAKLARITLAEIVEQLAERGYRLTGAAILLGSGRTLPGMEKILGSHPMIHTAEGEFFRQAFRNALEALDIPVTGIIEKELAECARKALGKIARQTQERVESAGRVLGAPWTEDQKKAMLAATIVLANAGRVRK